MIFKIIAIAILSCFSIIVLKQIKPEFAVLLSVVSGVVIVLMCLESFTSVFAGIENLVVKTGVSSGIIKLVLKIVGIGYLVEFGANICSDAGSSALAEKLLFAGKVSILIMAMPIINNLAQIITELLP